MFSAEEVRELKLMNEVIPRVLPELQQKVTRIDTELDLLRRAFWVVEDDVLALQERVEILQHGLEERRLEQEASDRQLVEMALQQQAYQQAQIQHLSRMVREIPKEPRRLKLGDPPSPPPAEEPPAIEPAPGIPPPPTWPPQV